MNAYETAQSLGLTGTDAEIVAQLVATGVTERPISLAYLMEMLNLRAMLRKTDGSGGQERWQGSLQNLKGALVALGLTDKVTAYEMWFSHVTNPRQVAWDTTLVQYAAGFWEMYINFAGGELMPSAEDFQAIAALGGGWKFATLTEQEYADQVTAAAEEAAAATWQLQQNVWRGRFDATLNTLGTAEQADGIADLRAIANEMEGA